MRYPILPISPSLWTDHGIIYKKMLFPYSTLIHDCLAILHLNTPYLLANTYWKAPPP